MMVDFKVTRTPRDEISFETLPVAKITHYPAETGSYKPYAQFCFCVSPKYYAFRMMAFEAVTTPESKVMAYLYPFIDSPNSGLLLSATPDKHTAVEAWYYHQGAQKQVFAQAHHHDGEDLQGIYWGWDVVVPLAELERFGAVFTQPGEQLLGNFYKTQTVVPKHYGSFVPAVFANDQCFAPESMGRFEIVEY